MGLERTAAEKLEAFGQAVLREAWPTIQAGHQDLYNQLTRMTLDDFPDASVPGQAGVSTQRELYELQHPEREQPDVEMELE